MKKFTLLLSFSLFSIFTWGQAGLRLSSGNHKILSPVTGQHNPTKIAVNGDTLLYIPFLGLFVNPTDSAVFDILNEDLDNHANDPGTITSQKWGYFYSLDPTDLMPGDVDSAFYIAATSWFAPVGQADNWYEFGPITIPATGAHLKWMVKNNPYGRDGYEVLLSTTGMDNYNSFTNPAVYSRTDARPDPNEAIDTIWQMQSINIDASTFGGQTVYFGFHHNANDMDLLCLDNFLVLEGPLAVNENFDRNDYLHLSQNYPNPASNVSYIDYELNKNCNVSIKMVDLSGRDVLNNNYGMQVRGNHHLVLDLKSLSKGVYFYTLNADGKTVTKKITVM